MALDVQHTVTALLEVSEGGLSVSPKCCSNIFDVIVLFMVQISPEKS